MTVARPAAGFAVIVFAVAIATQCAGCGSSGPSSPDSQSVVEPPITASVPAGAVALSVPVMGAQAQPALVTVDIGASAMLAVSGQPPDPNATIQWLRNGQPIPGATSPTLSLPAAQCADAANVFRAMVRSTAGSVFSHQAVLEVRGCIVSVVAGALSLFGLSIDGPRDRARFLQPWALAVDPTGGLLVADTGALRSLTLDGVVSTLIASRANAGSVDGPLTQASVAGAVYGATSDQNGTIYLLDGRTIRKVTRDGTVSTLAGANVAERPRDGVGSDARFVTPWGIAADRSGNLYVTDLTAVRKVAPDGTVRTIAGRDGIQGWADGPGADARFFALRGVVVDAEGMVYVADIAGTVRRIAPDGKVTTLAGTAGESGLADGVGPTARFNGPQGLALDASGSLLVADGVNHRVRRVTPDGVVTTLPFVVVAPAPLDQPEIPDKELFISGIAVDSTNRIWLTAPFDRVVLSVDRGGAPEIVAGVYASQGFVDALGVQARLGAASRLAVANDGTLYVADSGTVRSVDRFGQVRTIAGTTEGAGVLADGKGAAARFERLWAVTLDPAGNLYALDGSHLRRVAADGSVTTVQDFPSRLDPEQSGVIGTIFDPRFLAGNAAAVDADGTWFVGNACQLGRITADGALRYLWGPNFDGSCDGQLGGPTSIRSVAVAPDGTVLALTGSELLRFTKSGRLVASWAVSGFGMTVDSSGTVFVSLGDRIARFSATGARNDGPIGATALNIAASPGKPGVLYSVSDGQVLRIELP